MAYVISDSCVSCGACEGQCPVGAISQGDTQFEISADTCIDCGSCAGACPTGAIAAEQDEKIYFVNSISYESEELAGRLTSGLIFSLF